MNKNKVLPLKISFRQKIILVFFGLFLFFVLLEASLRLGGFILLSIQEHRNLQSIKQKGVYRIMCLGESTTQGQYPEPLEKILNQRNIGVHFSVIDKGRVSTNILAILSKVESYIDKYHPDAVITMMGINDLGEHIPYEVVTASKITLFLKSFRTYKLSRLLWLHILTKAKEIGFYKPNKDRRSSGKVKTDLSGIELKEAPVKSIPTEGAFMKAIEINPKNPNAYLELGGLYKAQGKLVDSEQAFQKAIELNPKNYNSYLELGRIYRVQDKFLQAEESFKQAIELNPENDNAYFELGRLYRDQSKFIQSDESFKQAIEINPENDNAYLELGWLYEAQGKLVDSEQAFKQAIKLNPKNDNAYVKLGWLYRDQGKFTQAEESFKQAIDLNPKNGNAYNTILVFYEGIGKPELAKEYIEKANRSGVWYYNLLTVNNYRKLKQILDKRGIRLVCVQYPMRNVEPLKKIFENDEGVIFVDNETIFKEAVKKSGLKEVFRDMFGVDFGHCTPKGNRLLATNIADTILKEIFGK